MMSRSSTLSKRWTDREFHKQSSSIMSCEGEHYHGSHNHTNENGHEHHDHSHESPIDTNISQSLLNQIDIPRVKALNVTNAPDEVGKIFKSYPDRNKVNPTLISDCDGQIILHIPFINGMVKLHSLVLRTNSESYCPKTIKLWKNIETIDFDNASTLKPTYVLTHPQVGLPDYEEGDDQPDYIDDFSTFVEHALPRHIFSGVHHLTVFIEDDYEDNEETRIHHIELRGEFTKLTRDPVITIYESAPNPADHVKLTSDATSATF